MRSRFLLVSFVFFGALSCAIAAQSAVEADPGGCPTPETRAIPAQALNLDAELAVEVPLVPNPSTLDCEPCGVHFQEVFREPPFNETANLTSLSFRLDAATPLETVPGDLCWSIEVTLGTFPFDGVVLPEFASNIEDSVVVYDGPLCLIDAEPLVNPTLGEELQIEFSEPYSFDPTHGELVVEVSIDGLVGSDQGFLLDATTGKYVTTVVSNDDSPDYGEVIDGGPIVVVDGIPGAELPGLPWECIKSLDAPSYVVARLVRYLDAAEWASDHGYPWLVRASMRAFDWKIDRYERRGVISEVVADRAHELGDEAAVAYFAPTALAKGLSIHSDASLLMTLVFLPEMADPMIADGSPADEALHDLEDAVEEILFDGVIDENDAEAVDDWDVAFGEFLRRGWRDFVDETRSLMRDARRWWREARELLDDPMFGLYLRLLRILADDTIDASEAEALIEIAKEIEELGEDGPTVDIPYVDFVKEAVRMLGDLATLLKSGDLIEITVTPHGPNAYLIYLKTTDEFYLKLFDVKDPILTGDYTITPWVWVDHLAFVWRVTEDGHQIEIVPRVDENGNETYTCELNLDSDGWFVVSGLSSQTDLDLDEVTITGVTYTSKGIRLEGISDDGEDVVIVLRGQTLKVWVAGRQTFPK